MAAGQKHPRFNHGRGGGKRLGKHVPTQHFALLGVNLPELVAHGHEQLVAGEGRVGNRLGRKGYVPLQRTIAPLEPPELFVLGGPHHGVVGRPPGNHGGEQPQIATQVTSPAYLSVLGREGPNRSGGRDEQRTAFGFRNGFTFGLGHGQRGRVRPGRRDRGRFPA